MGWPPGWKEAQEIKCHGRDVIYTWEQEANILDFASMILKNFETLNHVGGVVLASDDEKLKIKSFQFLTEKSKGKNPLAYLENFSNYIYVIKFLINIYINL